MTTGIAVAGQTLRIEVSAKGLSHCFYGASISSMARAFFASVAIASKSLESRNLSHRVEICTSTRLASYAKADSLVLGRARRAWRRLLGKKATLPDGKFF